MDITFFILLSLISFFCTFYGWQTNGINFVFLLLASGIFAILSFSSFDITWTYAMNLNGTATSYVVTQQSIDFVRLYGLLSLLSFVMALGKVAILAEEQLDYNFGPVLTKIKNFFNRG